MDLRAKSIKFLKENIATNLHDLGFGNGHQKMDTKKTSNKGKK